MYRIKRLEKQPGPKGCRECLDIPVFHISGTVLAQSLSTDPGNPVTGEVMYQRHDVYAIRCPAFSNSLKRNHFIATGREHTAITLYSNHSYRTGMSIANSAALRRRTHVPWWQTDTSLIIYKLMQGGLIAKRPYFTLQGHGHWFCCPPNLSIPFAYLAGEQITRQTDSSDKAS
jgi:hypothetical protein